MGQEADGTAALPEASTTALLTVECRRGVVGEHSALPELSERFRGGAFRERYRAP